MTKKSVAKNAIESPEEKKIKKMEIAPKRTIPKDAPRRKRIILSKASGFIRKLSVLQ